MNKNSLSSFVVNDLIYQKAAELSFTWGEDWGNLAADRIKKLYPSISNEQLKSITEECIEIKKYTKNLMHKNIHFSSEEVLFNIEVV